MFISDLGVYWNQSKESLSNGRHVLIKHGNKLTHAVSFIFFRTVGVFYPRVTEKFEVVSLYVIGFYREFKAASKDEEMSELQKENQKLKEKIISLEKARITQCSQTVSEEDRAFIATEIKLELDLAICKEMEKQQKEIYEQAQQNRIITNNRLVAHQQSYLSPKQLQKTKEEDRKVQMKLVRNGIISLLSLPAGGVGVGVVGFALLGPIGAIAGCWIGVTMPLAIIGKY